MQTYVAEAVEPPDNPLPTADPAIAPMRRPCMERGCQFRSRAVVYGGWLLAVLALLTNVAIGHDLVQLGRARAALAVERDTLRAQLLLINRYDPLPLRQAPAPSEVVLPAPPPAEPVRARPRPRPKSVSDMPPPVPESEKWWNR